MFNVAIRIEGIESRRRSAGLLHIVVGLFLIVKASDYYKLIEYRTFLPVIPMLLVGSFSIFYGLFRKRIDITYKYNYLIRLAQVMAFAFLSVTVITHGPAIHFISVFAFTILCILLLFSERRIFQETLLVIDDKGVKIPGYYRDHHVLWHDLSDIVVREDFITLFHVKQKYLQYQVMQDLSTLEIAKMNAFCKEKIGDRQTVAGNTLN